MTSLSSDKEFIAYLCPREWKPVGICVYYPNNDIEEEKTEDESSVDLVVYLCPEGHYCDGVDVTALLLPEGQEEVSCLLLTPACEDIKEESGLEGDRSLILDLHNNARATHPEECPNPEHLELDEKLNACAQWFAEDMAKYDYYAPDHVDRLGRPFWKRQEDFGVSWVGAGENIAFIEMDSLPSDEELVNIFFNGWMNSPPHRHNIMEPRFNRLGFGLARTSFTNEEGQYREKAFAVVDFAKIENEDTEINSDPPQLPCSLPEIQKIRWSQSYTIETYWDHSGNTPVQRTKRVPGNQLIFRAKLPPLCLISRAEFRFEISPCNWVLDPVPLLQHIPEDNSLKLTWQEDGTEYYFIDKSGNLTIRFNITQACFIPGEWIALYIWIKGYTDCAPIVWAATWFETKCFTSGIIQGCGLLDGDNVISGGYLADMDNSWIGDERLHWLVWFKGNLYWLKSSDWTKYRIGERCFIYKNGLGIFKRSEDDSTYTVEGCRWPTVAECDKEEAIIADSNVSYALNKEQDIIVPYKFMGIGA